MKTFALLIISLIFITTVSGQTELPSSIASDMVLTSDNSPYAINSNVSVQSGATLTINAGVTLQIKPLNGINIKGRLIVNGTNNSHVIFKCTDDTRQWNYISTDHANINVNYAEFRNGRRVINGSYGDSIIISHCEVSTTSAGFETDCFAFHNSKFVLIEHSLIDGVRNGNKVDAIDLDEVDSCIIRNNRIMNVNDDAVDIGTQTKYAGIFDNIVSGVNYGITVGEQSTAVLKRIISFNNDGGLQTHNGSNISVENCVLYSNTVGIECYHSEQGNVQSGGNAIIINTIFSHSKTQGDITKQTSSSINISYSISDKDTLPGDHNLFGDPLFRNPADSDFRLMPNSPCINTGSPDSPKDTTGNKIDIGAIEFYPSDTIPVDTGTLIQYNEESALVVFPNPVKDILIVKSLDNNMYPLNITCFDLFGKMCLKKVLTDSELYVDLSNLNPGLYLIRIEYNGQSLSRKIIKQ